MNETKPTTSRLALRVSLISTGMILAVYVFMQILAYFRDNALFGIGSVAALPAYVAGFVAMYVIPPAIVFGIIMYLYAKPLERALDRLRGGGRLDDATAEKVRVSMLRFSWLVLFLNIFGFALGYAILVLVQDGVSGFASAHRLIILVSNVAGASMYASAQSSLHNIEFAELRDRLGLTEIGTRKREIRSTVRQVGHIAAVVIYAATFMEFNLHDLFAYQDLAVTALSENVSAGSAGGMAAAERFRGGLADLVPGIAGRPGFSAASVPLPWESGIPYQAREVSMFLLTAFFLVVVILLCQVARSLETKDQLAALNARILDVIEGEGDLTKRLSLRSTDEFGQLAESVNRLIERFRSVVFRMAHASAESRSVAASIDAVMKDSETATLSACDSVIALSGSIEGQVGESRSLARALDSFRAATAAVADAVESQRRFTDETASAMEEMSANIRSVETMTRRAGDVTAALSAKGETGNGSVSETSEAIREIEKAAANVLKVLGSLSKIAGDTNLLAMNAAIEAAHAGSSGAGFAVVADEVRTLASSAARQTQTIKSLVSEMGKKVQRGVEASATTGQAFESLEHGIGEAAAITSEIAGAMREQAAGTRSVEDSIAQVVDTTRSVRDRMEAQERETEAMAAGLESVLSRLSALALSARDQADSVRRLETAFLAVRREVDRNLVATNALERELSGFKV